MKKTRKIFKRSLNPRTKYKEEISKPDEPHIVDSYSDKKTDQTHAYPVKLLQVKWLMFSTKYGSCSAVNNHYSHKG
jgi:hypothetical protein